MYIDAYIIPVPAANKAEYTDIAQRFCDIASDHGALELFENWESDVPDGEQTDFRKAVQATAEEQIVFSWVIWPDRATCDTAHKAMFEDPRMAEFGAMPFDGKRMVIGRFEPIVSFRKN